MVQVHHRTTTVDGHEVFHREAGPGAPPAEEFTYTFDALAEVTAHLLSQLGAARFAVLVQDYGAPAAWRLALREDPEVTAVISQNSNAHEEGFAPSFWDPLWAYAAALGPATEAPVRAALGHEGIRWQCTHGLTEPDVVNPDTWTHDLALVSRPGNDQVQLAPATTRPTAPCTRACTSGSAPAGSPCWRSGAGTTRSSCPRGRAHSAVTCPTPRCTCWTPGTSPWRATWARSPRSSWASSTAGSPDPTAKKHHEASRSAVRGCARARHRAGDVPTVVA